MSTTLSVVIVNWNTRDLVMQCLASVYTSSLDTPEVLVVDNASTDGSAAAVSGCFSQVRLIQNRENVGFAQANNQAIQECTGRYVLLLNSDAQVRAGGLETLVQFMETHPEAGAAGAQILNPDGSLQLSCYPAPTLTRELWRLLHLDAFWPYGEYHMTGWDLEAPREVETMLGACLILRREALDQTGLLDPDYFMYSEEIDLCYRLRRKGWHLYWMPLTQVIHHGGQSTRQVAYTMFLQLYNKNLADEPLALMQLGYALMIGKPIGVLVKKGEEVPEKLRAAADLVEEFDPEDPQSLTAATKKLLSILEGRR